MQILIVKTHKKQRCIPNMFDKYNLRVVVFLLIEVLQPRYKTNACYSTISLSMRVIVLNFKTRPRKRRSPAMKVIRNSPFKVPKV